MAVVTAVHVHWNLTWIVLAVLAEEAVRAVAASSARHCEIAHDARAVPAAVYVIWVVAQVRCCLAVLAKETVRAVAAPCSKHCGIAVDT